MQKEIKKYLIAGIAVVCMLLLTSCQDLPNGERPFDYGPAKWVSESGDLWFEVTQETVFKGGTDYPVLDGEIKVGDEIFECKAGFDMTYYIRFWEKSDWEKLQKSGGLKGEKVDSLALLAGVCRFGKKKLVVHVLDEVGQYFNGEKITFIRYPVEETSKDVEMND